MSIPIRVKLTLWYSLAMLTTLAIFSYVTYSLVAKNLYQLVDQSLLASISQLQTAVPLGVRSFSEKDSSGSIEYFRLRQNNWLIYESQRWGSLEITGKQNTLGSWNWHRQDGRTFRVRTQRMVVDSTDEGAVIISVAENTDQIESSLIRLMRVISVGLPVVFIFTVSIGYFLARRSLLPLRDIARDVKHINANRLAHRININNPNDEIGDLGQALNYGFERLEQAFLRLQRFTADASHELRTPLSVIRSVGELALRKSANLTVKDDSISSMLEEVARLEQLVDNLLLLARADSGENTQSKASVDVGKLLKEVVDCLEILADEKQQKILLAIEEKIEMVVYKDCLQRALLNVLDNAIRYTPQKGSIMVSLKRQNDLVRIEIQDSGPGVPTEESEKIFERFYRLDDARSRGTGGSGLGLALARWGVEINGATIKHEQNNNRAGSKFVIQFG